MIVEGPVWQLSRSCQLGVYYWFRLLSRLWGRAWFYLFVSLLSFVQLETLLTATGAAGIYLICLVPFMFVISRTSAMTYQRIYVFVAAGTEGDEREAKFQAKFEELDPGKTGFIGSAGIVKLAADSGRMLSNAERHTIQTFLDVSANGKVSKDDFLKQFRTYNLKQKFL